MSLSLLVMTPTRWRRENCERMLKTFNETADFADIAFIIDSDDEDTYADMDWGDALHPVMDPPGPVRAKVNNLAAGMVDIYDALMYVGDDHTFNTPHWDTIMMTRLEELGGTGIIYGNDKRRSDIPETVIISSDIVKCLGHFEEPTLDHYYVDNVWSELGRRAIPSLHRYYDDVIFEHFHYQVNKNVERDQTYIHAEVNWGQSDYYAYQNWMKNIMPSQVSKLRRQFNPDTIWVREQF